MLRLVRAPRMRTLLLALVLCSSDARGELYSFVDSSGTVRTTDDLEQVPAAQREVAAARARGPSRIHVIARERRLPPASLPSGNGGAVAPPWAPARVLPRFKPEGASPSSDEGLERRGWERRFREVREGLAHVEACRDAIPEGCSRTMCRSRYAWEAGLCRDGWHVPRECERAFATPRGSVSPAVLSGDARSYSCEPLRAAADQAEQRWREAEYELEREATEHQIPTSWRYPD